MCRPLFSLLLTSLTTPTPPLTTPTTTPLFVATFPILYVLEAAPAFFAKSPLSFICCHLSYPLCFGSSTCFFFAKSPLSSPLLCFADDEIVQVHTLYRIWADDQELMRNLASLPTAPTLPSPLFSVMMPWCSKFMIKWWLTCFWGLYYCYYSFFWYIVVL